MNLGAFDEQVLTGQKKALALTEQNEIQVIMQQKMLRQEVLN